MVLMIFTGIFCLMSGFTLSLPFLIEQNVPFHGIKDVTDKFKVYLALISIIIGIINLFGAYDIFIVGNLLPAAALLLSGLGLSDKLLTYINLSVEPEKSDSRKEKVKNFLKKFSILIGIMTFIVGIMHFFLWTVVIF